MSDEDKTEVTFELGENLEVHHLDVTPNEEDQSIEFELHATIRNVDDEKIETVRNSRLQMTELVCSKASIEHD